MSSTYKNNRRIGKSSKNIWKIIMSGKNILNLKGKKSMLKKLEKKLKDLEKVAITYSGGIEGLTSGSFDQ